MRKILLYIGIAAIVAGCAKDKSSNGTPSDGAAKFTAEVNSRVSGTNWEDTDEVGIIVIDKDGQVSDKHPFNAYHTVSTAGVFTPFNDANTIYYSIDPYDYIDFYAYYPYDSDVDENLIYSIDLSEQSDPTKIDFMEAYTEDRYTCENDTAVQLTFTRRLTKFTINLNASNGFSLADVTGVSFEGFHTTADYDLWDRGFKNLGGDEKSITPYKDGDSYSAILIPMEDFEDLYYLDEEHYIVIATTKGNVIWELDDSENDTEKEIVLKAGSEHTFNVTISREDVNGEAEIEGWTEVDTNESFNTDNN